MALEISKIQSPNIIVQGAHRRIIQSILDFDYLAGKKAPSISAVLSAGRKNERFFFGNSEILLPLFKSFDLLPEQVKEDANFFLNLSSGRRVFASSKAALEALPNLVGASIFAENTPERHSLELVNIAKEKNVWIAGPSSVGFCLPQVLKLGAIGGIDHTQITGSRLLEKGKAAVLSCSGGMTNEMINLVAKQNLGVSFAMSFGGDRFPIIDPQEAFLAAENDPNTKCIVYFGELGGEDEYRIVEMLDKNQLTKPVVAYIAGSVSDLFKEPPQFGHAKAMAASVDESAKAKRKALGEAGAIAPETFSEFINQIKLMGEKYPMSTQSNNNQIDDNRNPALFVSSISKEDEDGLKLAGKTLEDYANGSYGAMLAALLTGHQPKSKEFPALIELILKLLADHGPHVSGAVNTMVSARAGRDLVSSLSSGLLTIGPRFGGAINESAKGWLSGANEGIEAREFVESFAKNSKRIQGIGHKKYRVDKPDPRVELLTKNSISGKYLDFARAVEEVTTAKSGNLILNVDGCIAAVLLDTLEQKEGYSKESLEELVNIEFFNALFVLARSVGFTAHYLDQKRLDEGLFRLNNAHVAEV